MSTGSIKHNIEIANPADAERFVEALEEAERISEEGMERLTEIKTHVTGFSYTDKKEGIFAQNVYAKLAAYEDSQMTPEEVQSLAKAKADGRLKILPAKPGDTIYRPEALQFCWVIANVEIYEDEIVFIDDSDNIFRPDDIGKTVFLTREEAEKALGGAKDGK